MTKSLPRIGKFCTIAPDVDFGERVILHGFSNLYGCRIGDDCRIGTFVEIQRNTVLGKRVRVQSHSFICSNIEIEDDVFIGHNVSFINDRYPTSSKAEEGSWEVEQTRVCIGASIGTGAVILCGIEIGEGSVIGAGSVITKDVEPHTVVAGVPAKVIRKLKLEERGMGGKTS
ncbi:MAG: N-acetyltransferase [Nitrosomonadaceae bacterium]|nr:N-acetyltransferase [Nitrosomonadaceae bacterium]|tara:strand:+ start:2245 stop:2760 length:516 start_codon:yes stop_codon:yes gene_type:complete